MCKLWNCYSRKSKSLVRPGVGWGVVCSTDQARLDGTLSSACVLHGSISYTSNMTLLRADTRGWSSLVTSGDGTSDQSCRRYVGRPWVCIVAVTPSNLQSIFKRGSPTLVEPRSGSEAQGAGRVGAAFQRLWKVPQESGVNKGIWCEGVIPGHSLIRSLSTYQWSQFHSFLGFLQQFSQISGRNHGKVHGYLLASA